MHLKSLELSGFKSFAKKGELFFTTPVTAIVGPNGSGKSNVAEAFRFVLGEQSIKSLRGKKTEDLIFNGSAAAARANRASVKLVFDNHLTGQGGQRLLNIDFDEVSIERVVYRDGQSEYLINGSSVRLKDIVELLAAANIGSSGHHIISQGEADRVLSANPKERREMIEDALGLRVYQYKKSESLKKLEKTEENKKQVEALKKEHAPHLRFLEKQMEKIAKARELREKIIGVYQDYLKREELYLNYQEEIIKADREQPEESLRELTDELTDLKETIARTRKDDADSGALVSKETEVSAARQSKDEIYRSLGRIEGKIAFEEARKAAEAGRVHHDDGVIPLSAVREFEAEIESFIGEIEKAADLEGARTVARGLRERTAAFIRSHQTQTVPPDTSSIDASIEALINERTSLEASLAAADEKIRAVENEIRTLKASIESKKDEGHDAERRMFEIMAKQNELRTVLSEITSRATQLARDREDFKRELAEAGSLVGRAALAYGSFEPMTDGAPLSIEDLMHEDRTVQNERRRELEKLKIRLEELGGGSAEEIEKEFTEAKDRDAFLEREIADLENSSNSLRTLIGDLERELDVKFKEGIAMISKQFEQFFNLMFGGGSAELVVVKEKKRRSKLTDLLFGEKETDEMEEDEEEGEEGIDISVSLPHKRVKGLMMLSGGERALTSIALIFAMSQVNPPPFIILDETDAALDEANSRRYGDMVSLLAEKSQLIVITHNRETMSRAGVLYGITMGADGASKLLSVKFEEAVAVAK